MRFARLAFWTAGIWGLLVLAPLYFIAETIGRRQPPPITHLEYYYGFLGVTLAWQLAFFVIGSDPVRFRLMMLPAMLEKFGHIIAMAVLCVAGEMSIGQLAFNLPDLVLGVLFVIAFLKTRPSRQAGRGAR